MNWLAERLYRLRVLTGWTTEADRERAHREMLDVVNEYVRPATPDQDTSRETPAAKRRR